VTAYTQSELYVIARPSVCLSVTPVDQSKTVLSGLCQDYAIFTVQ